MRNHRLTIAHSVAKQLFAAEEAIDLALARIAELNAALPRARLDARLSACIGQDAICSSTGAAMLIAQAREQVIATHASLKNASDHIGLRETSYGDLLKAPSAGHQAGEARLRII
jgi:hypothetical protein